VPDQKTSQEKNPSSQTADNKVTSEAKPASAEPQGGAKPVDSVSTAGAESDRMETERLRTQNTDQGDPQPEEAEEHHEIVENSPGMQAYMEALSKGFLGGEVDPTPDEHYTVGGVLEGKPTPETDTDAHHEAFMATRGPQLHRG
jgi:hypothetical protein